MCVFVFLYTQELQIAKTKARKNMNIRERWRIKEIFIEQRKIVWSTRCHKFYCLSVIAFLPLWFHRYTTHNTQYTYSYGAKVMSNDFIIKDE